jgi:cytochrome c oxidase subunit IV
MKAYYNIHTIWLVMMLLTISTYAMGKFGYDGIIIMLVLLLTAVIKGSFIIRDFMELNGVSLLWRVIMYGWLWIICFAIALAYIISI